MLPSLHFRHSSTGLNSNISNMRINLWFCSEMKQWRWTLIKNDIPICKQESGQRPDLHTAMEDIENTVKYLMNQNINNDA